MTTGPDEIPAFLLKDCAPILAPPLTILLNLCLEKQIFPKLWKRSKVCPVFKKGPKFKLPAYKYNIQFQQAI